MKKSLLFFVALSLKFLCLSQESQIALKDKDGTGPFSPTNVILMPELKKQRADSVPPYLTGYVIRKIEYQGYNTSYKEVAAHGISKTEFLKHYGEKLDSNLLTAKDYNHSYNVLIGKSTKNTVAIIVDSNRNNNYTDDKAFLFPVLNSVEKEYEAMKRLPTIELPFQLFDGKQFIAKSYKIQLNPYKGNLSVKFADPLENDYFLKTNVSVHKQGETFFNKKPYEIYLYGGAGYANATLMVSPKGIEPMKEGKENIPYKKGDIVTVDGHQYQFSDLSFFGDTITFKYVGYTNRPEGFDESYYAPAADAKTVDGKAFQFSDYIGKYVLLDFWGTWCVPCLKALPEIKRLNQKFKNKDFVLVSVANDSDLEEVRKSISKNEMNWINVFQNERAGGNETNLIEKLKISAYPTLILIDKDGKIISRGESIEKVEQLLMEKFK